nr:chemotaxis-specific protein-glutamate methyltransferase CheB [Lachnospiraceae bacterium]
MDSKKKKILVIDDSALMRRIVCDIIALDDRFCVQDMAANGVEAIALLKQNVYDVVILDVVMPKLDGIGVLMQIRELDIRTTVVMYSTATSEGAATTIKALELGAVDFIHKPSTIMGAKTESFMERFLSILECAAEQNEARLEQAGQSASTKKEKKTLSDADSQKIVAIASSTGGPKALQEVIPYLPADLDAPVLIVQHMPEGFTASLAQRLDELSPLTVREAEDGMEIRKGNVYLARGGKHMEVSTRAGKHYLVLKDGPTREGVRPCANFMYETLGTSEYDSIICVVLTGMGADGTQGILNLSKQKDIYVIAQEQSTCAVYGMPRSIVATGMADRIEPLDNIASAIILNAGVQ